MSEAEKSLGYYDGEHVLYGSFEPKPGQRLPVVHFAYVPLTPNQMQEISREMEGISARQASRLSVRILARQLRRWTLRRPDGTLADCRSSEEIGRCVDNNIVEAVCEKILSTESVEEAERALADFPKP